VFSKEGHVTNNEDYILKTHVIFYFVQNVLFKTINTLSDAGIGNSFSLSFDQIHTYVLSKLTGIYLLINIFGLAHFQKNAKLTLK